MPCFGNILRRPTLFRRKNGGEVDVGNRGCEGKAGRNKGRGNDSSERLYERIIIMMMMIIII